MVIKTKDRPDKRAQYNTKYYQLNKEAIDKKRKEYRQNNLERLTLYSRNYNETHKERFNELRRIRYRDQPKIAKIINEPEQIKIDPIRILFDEEIKNPIIRKNRPRRKPIYNKIAPKIPEKESDFIVQNI
jgi:hypothetical protein